MDTQTAYSELGLEPGASDAQIKAAWRKLVAAWHPDRNPASDAVRRMQTINKAYQHIRQLREGGSADEDTSATEAEAEPAQDKAPPNATRHLRTIELTLEEAILGCTRTVRGHFSQVCQACLGKGQRVLAQACGTCHGSGALHKPALFGWLWNEEECETCGGDGRKRAVCDACDGCGAEQVPYKRQVRFPAGVRDGHVLTLPSYRVGDVEICLELQVQIEPHPFFQLDETGTLRCDLPVNGYAWMAGRWVDIPTPDGMQHMRLSRDALVYRLRGQGFPATPRGARGDYLVKVQPVFPETEDAALTKLLDQLIAHVDRTQSADAEQPLGQWKRKLKRWKAKDK